MRRLIIIPLTFFAIAAASAQQRDAVQSNIDRLNSQIAEYERQIRSIRSDRKSAQAEVNKLSGLIKRRRSLVREVNNQMSQINGNIGSLSRQIDDLNNRRERLREEYAGMVRTAYRNYRQHNFVTYLFSAEDFNAATRRIASIRLVNDARLRKVAELDSLQRSLDESMRKLDEEKAALKSTQSKYDAELKKLSADEQSYKKRVNSLTARERKVLKAQQAQQRELERLVSSTRKAKGRTAIGGNIKDNRGRLPMPVEGGRIKPNGSDIAEITGARGAAVKAVFNGEVMRVTYNRNAKAYIVLVGHGDYFTTYSNMATVSVKEGQKVTLGQSIGTLGQSVGASGKSEYKLVFGIFSPSGDALHAASWIR